MKNEKSGGYAFPVASHGGTLHLGMTLRDYFAAHAPIPNEEMLMDEHCEYRYRYADAMIVARTAAQAATDNKE